MANRVKHRAWHATGPLPALPCLVGISRAQERVDIEVGALIERVVQKERRAALPLSVWPSVELSAWIVCPGGSFCWGAYIFTASLRRLLGSCSGQLLPHTQRMGACTAPASGDEHVCM